MSSFVTVTIYDAPSEFKMVIVPTYGDEVTYYLGGAIHVDGDTTSDIDVPRDLAGTSIISVSVIYQVGPITNCIPGISIPSDRGIGLQFITTGCVTFVIPTEPLSGTASSYDTITVGELKYTPTSETPDGILQKKGETVAGVEISDNSIPYMYDDKLSSAVLKGTTNQVSISSSYDIGTDTVDLTLSLPQDIGTTSTPEFQAVSLKPDGGSGPVTITAAPSVSSRTHEIPDTGIACDFVMTAGNQTVDGKKILTDLEVEGDLLPAVSTGTKYIGTSDRGWQRLYIGNEKKVGEDTVKGSIVLGHAIRAEDRAEVFINSMGDSVAEIFLGRDEPISSNIKWGISSRPSYDTGGGDALKFFRGPFLTGGGFEEVLSMDAVTGAITLASDTDSTSTTTGAITTKGGLGVAKTIHSATVRTGSLYLASTGGVPAPLNRYEEFTVNTTLWGAWNTEKPITLRVTIIGRQVFLRFSPINYPTDKTVAYIFLNYSLPLRIRVNDQVTHLFNANHNSQQVTGLVYILHEMVTFYKVGSTEWTHVAGGSISWDCINMNYTLV